MFRRIYWLEPDKGDLHGQKGSNGVNGAVSNVDTMGKPSCSHQGEDMKGDEVDQEHISSPGRHLSGFILFKVDECDVETYS